MTSTIPAPDLARLTQKSPRRDTNGTNSRDAIPSADVTEPPFRDNRDLRQALSMAVDRDLIADHVTVGVTPAYTFVANGISGYKPPGYEWSDGVATVNWRMHATCLRTPDILRKSLSI